MLVPKLRFKREDGTEYPEWEEKYVRKICSVSTGKSNTQDKIDEGQYPFYIRSPIIERSDKYLFDEEAVITVGDGVGTGKVYHYINGKYNLHQRCYRMYDFMGVSAKYFYYFFSTNFYKRIKSMSAKTSVDSVRMEMITDMLISIPCLEEQQKIADFLSTVDEVIAHSEKEVQNLEQQKKAAMQKIFSQEVRFRRDDGRDYPEWEETNLDSVGSFYGGLSGKIKKDFGKGNSKFVTYMNVYKNIFAIQEMLEHVDVLDTEKQNKVQYGDLLMTQSSETVEEVGMSSVYLFYDEPYLNSFCFGLHLYNHTHTYPMYVGYLMRSETIRKQIMSQGQGISRINLSPNRIKGIILPFPCIEEQQKIANFLSTYDETISYARQELDKWKKLKKGLLQQMFV